MPNTEIVSYINDQTQQGIAKDAIREALLQSGWAADAVEEGFATVDGHSGSPFPSAATVATAAITEKDYPVTLLWAFKSPIIFGLFLIVLFVVGYYSLPLVFFAIFTLIANPLLRTNFHYSLDEHFFQLKQGVIAKKQRNLPYGVIQNVFLKQDLFDRIFGLATLRIENAAQGGTNGMKRKSVWTSNRNANNEFLGSSGNTVNIPGLKKKDAEALKEVLLQKIKANPLADTGAGL